MSASALRIRRPSVTACPASRQGSRASASGTACGAVPAVAAGLAVILAAGLDRAHEALAAEHDAVGHHLALRDRRAEPPGGADQHLAVGGLAQAAAGGARRDQRLDQHRHRGVGRIEPVVVHVAARIGGPQRRPAGAHRGEKLGFVGDAEEALELAGEIGAGAILDQRRGADRAGLPARRALRAPGGEQRCENLRRDRLLIELEPDLDREPALLRRSSVGDSSRTASPSPRCAICRR